jgi:glycyl-tRNA synthetase
MGYYYALASNEPAEVAVGIREHYLPRFTGDSLPGTSPGLVVSLADRLDTLVGLFAAGLAPTGNRDPFAQRRAALGLVQILVGRQVDFDLRQATAHAARLLPVSASPATQDQVLAFIIERLRNLLLEQDQRYDIVDAVLSAQGHNPSRTVRAVSELAGWVSRGDWDRILPAYSRCVRITRDLAERYPVDPELFQETAEVDLYAALVQVESRPRQAGSVDEFLSAFLPMIPAINLFFDRVLVMTEEESVRQNRLGLLQRIAALAEDTVDMTKLEGF